MKLFISIALNYYQSGNYSVTLIFDRQIGESNGLIKN